MTTLDKLANSVPVGAKRKTVTTMVAIPCHNEARHIEGLVASLRQRVDLLLVVDDGSSDGTGHIAEKAGAMVVRHRVNQGKGVAMNTAFAKARELGVEALVLLDGDGQHDPDELDGLLQPVLEHRADVVIGSRFLNGPIGIPFYRSIGQRVLTLVANLGTGMSMTDTQCGYRAYSPRAIACLKFNQRQLGTVESEMQFLIKDHHLKALEVPVTAIYKENAKRNPVVQGFATLLPTLKMAIGRRPGFFATIAVLATLCSAAFVLVVLSLARVI